jgi:hypothetical protein
MSVTSNGVPWIEAEDTRPKGFGVSAHIPLDISPERMAELAKLAVPLIREMLAVPEKDRLDVLAAVVKYYIEVDCDDVRKRIK